jgi:hypothetical protein
MQVTVVLPRPPRGTPGQVERAEGMQSVLCAPARAGGPSGIVAVRGPSWSKDWPHVMRELADATELPQQM